MQLKVYFPADQAGIYIFYFIGVDNQGMCMGFIPIWHWLTRINCLISKLQLLEIHACGNRCGILNNTVNGDPAGDTMVSVIAHEIAEVITDSMVDATSVLGNLVIFCLDTAMRMQSLAM